MPDDPKKSPVSIFTKEKISPQQSFTETVFPTRDEHLGPLE